MKQRSFDTMQIFHMYKYIRLNKNCNNTKIKIYIRKFHLAATAPLAEVNKFRRETNKHTASTELI